MNATFEVVSRLVGSTSPRVVPLELVIWHLVAEGWVTPRIHGWRALLEEAIQGFDARRRAD